MSRVAVRQIERTGKEIKQLVSKNHSETKDRIDKQEKRLERVESQIPQPIEVKTPGQRFVEDESIKDLVSRGYAPGSKATVYMGQLFETKNTILASTLGSSTPGILTPERVPVIMPAAQRRLTIRDILPVRPTTTNRVEFVKENSFTSQASPQVEGEAKDESALTLTIDSEEVKTLAHHLSAYWKIWTNSGTSSITRCSFP